MYLNPSQTPRQNRLSDGHLVRVTAKKNKLNPASPAASTAEPTPAATPDSALVEDGMQEGILSSKGTPVSSPAMGPPQGKGKGPAESAGQQENGLCAGMESHLKLASGTGTRSPCSPQGPGSSLLGRLAQSSGNGPSDSGRTGKSCEADMLDRLDQALLHERRGKLCSLRDDSWGAALEFTNGLLLLDRAPTGKPPPSYECWCRIFSSISLYAEAMSTA